MARKLSFATSRRGGALLIRLLLLTFAGVLAGSLLGDLIAEPLALTRGSGLAPDHASYAQHSANPDALVAQGDTAPPCIACPGSYGVAARLRADRERRMTSAFRELGAVDIDAPLPDEPASEPADGYKYGGRFPDPDPRIETPNVEMESNLSPSGVPGRSVPRTHLKRPGDVSPGTPEGEELTGLNRSSLDRLDE